MARIWRSSSSWTNLFALVQEPLIPEEASTMASFRSREGAAQSATLPLMVISFVLIGGFMYWLSVTAEPTQVAIVEEDDDAATGAAVPWSTFGADPESHEGQTVTVSGVPVSSRLGTQAFWAELPNETPYLVKFGSQLVADSVTVSAGDRGDITGTVHMMSDSVLDAWEAAGAFSDPVNRIEAEFATSFLEAETFRVAPSGGG